MKKILQALLIAINSNVVNEPIDGAIVPLQHIADEMEDAQRLLNPTKGNRVLVIFGIIIFENDDQATVHRVFDTMLFDGMTAEDEAEDYMQTLMLENPAIDSYLIPSKYKGTITWHEPLA